jgi:serine/threonine protein kinase
MSPEQARAKDLDVSSDLFSFGAVLYEMATGQLPFRGESTATIFEVILNRAPVPAILLNPDLPTDLERIINRALSFSEWNYACCSRIRRQLAVQDPRLDGDSFCSLGVHRHLPRVDSNRWQMGSKCQSPSPRMGRAFFVS